MNQNKKGFALYELLITYSLAFVVITIIFSTIATLSTKLAKLYKEDNITANQLLVYRSIGNDFAYYSINYISQCTTEEETPVPIPNCASIVYEKNDGSIIQKQLLLGNNYITYDGVKTEFKYGTINKSNSSITSISTTYSEADSFLNRIIKLYIPISYEGENYNITLLCTNAVNIETNFPSGNLLGLFD